MLQYGASKESESGGWGGEQWGEWVGRRGVEVEREGVRWEEREQPWWLGRVR